MVQSPTLIQTLKLLLSLVTDVICSSVPIFANKKQKRWSHSKEHAIYGPGLRFFFVLMYMRTARSQTGTKVTRVGSATEMKSDRSEFIFRPIQCKHMKRNVWRPIRTHTGLSSSQSHARKYPLVLLVRESTFDLWFALFSSRKIDFKYRLLNFGFDFFCMATVGRRRSQVAERSEIYGDHCREKNWNCRCGVFGQRPIHFEHAHLSAILERSPFESKTW